ncbi:unnamed protein product, partial [Brenthis ino]
MDKITLQDHSYFTVEILKALVQNRITTLIQFIQEDAEKLSVLTKLNLPQILEIRNDIFSKYSAPLISGSTLFVRGFTCRKYIATGIESLDSILGGGISIGYISEIYGLACCGKTQLCTQLAINSVKDFNNTVLYIDTKGDFSAVRVQKILEGNGFSHKDMAAIMIKIKVIHIWSMEDLIKLLEGLKHFTLKTEKLSLIIIDSLPSLMLQHFGDNNKLGLTYLNKVVNLSRFLSKELEIGFVCVNIQTRWIDSDVRDSDVEDQTTSVYDSGYIEKRNRGLGKYWHHIPAVLILMEKNNYPVTDNNGCSIINITVSKQNIPYISKSCQINVNVLGVS